MLSKLDPSDRKLWESAMFKDYTLFLLLFFSGAPVVGSPLCVFSLRAAEKQKCLHGVSATINMAPLRGLDCAQKQNHIEPAEECGQGQAINAATAERAGAAGGWGQHA